MKKYLLSTLVFMPVTSFAFFDSLTGWRFANLANLINQFIPIVILASFVYIIYAIVVRFIRKTEPKKKRNWRIVKSFLLFIFIVFLWGMLGVVQSSFGIGRPNPNCQGVCGAAEFHAALDISRRDDIKSIMKKYPSSLAWVRPLQSTYIQDKEYLKRILPEYQNINIHCIVVAHSPEGTRFFLEDGDVHHNYIEIPTEDFLASLNNASDEDVTNFWLHLR